MLILGSRLVGEFANELGRLIGQFDTRSHSPQLEPLESSGLASRRSEDQAIDCYARRSLEGRDNPG